jgi:hypothetical protein
MEGGRFGALASRNRPLRGERFPRDFFEKVSKGNDEHGVEQLEVRLRDITSLPRHLTAAIAGLEFDDRGRRDHIQRLR